MFSAVCFYCSESTRILPSGLFGCLEVNLAEMDEQSVEVCLHCALCVLYNHRCFWFGGLYLTFTQTQNVYYSVLISWNTNVEIMWNIKFNSCFCTVCKEDCWLSEHLLIIVIMEKRFLNRFWHRINLHWSIFVIGDNKNRAVLQNHSFPNYKTEKTFFIFKSTNLQQLVITCQ